MNGIIKIANSKLKSGVWCKPEENDYDKPPPNGLIMKGSHKDFMACKSKNSYSGVEGKFEIMDKTNNQVISQVYFNSPIAGKNGLKIESNNDYVVSERFANINDVDRPLGIIEIIVKEYKESKV